MRKTPKPKTSNWYRKKCVERAKLEAKERDKWICQRCGRSRAFGYQIQGSHIFAEGAHTDMSAMVLNIKAMCAQCHWWWHENPIEATEWFKGKFPKRYEKLRIRAQRHIKQDWKKEWIEKYSNIV